MRTQIFHLIPRNAPITQVVAAFFKGRPEILGLELINEPFAGNLYLDPLIMVPGVADKLKLQPAYEAIHAPIRAADPDRLLVFAGTTWSNFGAGFTQPPGGAAHADHSVRVT